MSWAGWLVAALGPSLKSFLASLGFGFLTYSAASAVASAISDHVNSAWSGIPSATYQLLAMAGVVEGISVWLSALTSVVAMMALKRLAVVA